MTRSETLEQDTRRAEVADFYSRLGSQSMAEVKFRVAEIVQAQAIRTGNALDIGCGYGALLAHLCQLGLIQSGVGVDICDDAIVRARSLCKDLPLQFAESDAAALPYSDSSFDMVTCSEVVEHLPDWKQAMREWARVLRPEGLLVMSCPYYWNTLFLDKVIGDLRLRCTSRGTAAVEYGWTPFGPAPFENMLRVRALCQTAMDAGLQPVFWETRSLEVAVRASSMRWAFRPYAFLRGRVYWKDEWYAKLMARLARHRLLKGAGYKLYIAFTKPHVSVPSHT